MSSGLFPVRGLSIARFRAFLPGTCHDGERQATAATAIAL